ncbi:MAG: carboxypeptidase-like regulatory domain-containing protein [Prolixibacteraceae bacterium]|nr:carboxypeptidase-like regulatory domain-containing protein [Prolixibacteraceae bacterium]
MYKKQFSKLFSLKKSLLLIITLVLVSFVGGINALASESAQNAAQVKGIVTEERNSTPLPGVAVIIKGTTVGTITDIDGNFAIDAKSNDILVFSFIG